MQCFSDGLLLRRLEDGTYVVRDNRERSAYFISTIAEWTAEISQTPKDARNKCKIGVRMAGRCLELRNVTSRSLYNLSKEIHMSSFIWRKVDNLLSSRR
jgi:hypothetical protein